MGISNIREQFKKLRQEQNLSIRDLADKCGVSYTVLYDFELERAVPKIETLEKIFKALGKPIDIIITDDENVTNCESKYFKLVGELKNIYKLVESMEHVETVDKAISLATVKEILNELLVL